MTSIEWLIDQMVRQGYFDDKPSTFTNLDHLQQQAKEMHKQEIKDAWDDGIEFSTRNAEVYYNKTFKKD